MIVFKGPFMEDPQISIRSEVDGRQSAAFVDYPVRFTAEKGSFTLKEGGNVEVDAEGSLETGGRVHVDARVVHGDLMHVHVKGEGVPVEPAVTDRLDPEVRRMVLPFHPQGGTAGFDIVVSKSDPAARPVPHVVVNLQGVGVKPELFPLALTTTGQLTITPSWREGAGPEAKPRIQVDLAVEANGREATAAVVSGSVVLDPASKSGDWSGELVARCARLVIDKDLERALPPELESIRRNLSPQGALKDVRAHVRSTEVFEAEGSGDELSAALASFPYRTGIDRFSLARDGRTVSLRHVEGHTPRGGRFTLEGSLEMPPEEVAASRRDDSTSPVSRDPFVSVSIDAHDVPIDGALVAALPEDARGPVEKLEPTGGKLDARLSVVLAPPLPLELRGDVALSGARVALYRLDPSLAGLEMTPVEDVTGVLKLDGDRLLVEGVKARFHGARVVLGGSLAFGTSPTGDGTLAPGAGSAALDLVAHVDGLVLDETTRPLARGAAKAALEHYPVQGPCDLDLRIQRGGVQSTGTSVVVRIEPRGVKVVPQILPLPFEDVRGSIEIRGDDPVLVELTARVGRALVDIERDERQESFAPPDTFVFRVHANGIDPKEIAARGPEDLAKVIRDTDLTGLLDLAVDVSVPKDPRARSRFLAEVRTVGLDITSGLRFEKAVGVLQVSGSVAKQAPLELSGALMLEKVSCWKQDLTDARIPVRFREGVLLLGSPEDSFKGSFYGGQMRGRVETNFKTGHYSGYFYVEGANLGVASQELARLQKNGSMGPGTPIHGDLVGSLTFQGGGTDPDGRTYGISGDGAIQASKANLIALDGPFLGTIVPVFAAAAHGDSSFDPKAFDRVYTKLKLKPAELVIEELRLDSDTLTLVGTKGTLGWDGKIHLDLLPWQPGVAFEKIFKQFAGVSVRGTISKPDIGTMPFSNVLDDMWNQVKKVVASEDTKEPAGPGK